MPDPIYSPKTPEGIGAPQIQIQCGLYGESRITVDGHVLNGAIGYTLRQKPGEIPVLEIEMIGDIRVDGKASMVPQNPLVPQDENSMADYNAYQEAMVLLLREIKRHRDDFVRKHNACPDRR